VNVVEAVKPYLKSAVAFATPGFIALGVAVQDSSPGGPHVTSAEWVGILVACFVTGAAVWAVPNLPRKEPPE